MTLFQASPTAIRQTGAPLLIRAQESGEVRREIELADLHQVANAIALTLEHDSDATDRADRLLDLLVEGIRACTP